MKKTAKQSPRKAEQTDYRAWKAHAAALLERQGISAGVMCEKEWRKLFIKGARPEDAARHAEMVHNNTRPLLELMRAETSAAKNEADD
jgi:hypothetical protein